MGMHRPAVKNTLCNVNGRGVEDVMLEQTLFNDTTQSERAKFGRGGDSLIH